MKRIAILLFLLASPALAKSEAEYQAQLCAGNALEWRLEDGSRVDCVSATHAIEVDWSTKWAEAYGQALFYGHMTGLKAGIILICKRGCARHQWRLRTLIEATNAEIDVWACASGAEELWDDCVEW